MAHFKDATFEIISGGRSLPLYDDPDWTTEEDSGETQKYVEAVTGATFEVKVTLDQSFYWGDCDAVRVSVQFDDCKKELYVHIDRDAVLVTKTQFRSVALASMYRYHPESNQWTLGKFSFGALDVTETNDNKTSPQMLNNLGRIRVRYQRVYYDGVSSALSKAEKAARYTKYDRISSVSEKTLKGQSIDTLQMIGCIPSTPQESSSTPDATNPPKDVTEEMKQLRARLAELENTHVKSERRGATPGTLKREREDQENTNQRKQRRQPGPVETVDLTGD
ncbi:MAG: hypothetical protein LQ350_003770 [Teloschistes chrysophthalmus]|nr:MAG: hypothetical protein LQ350_003770 [Niorma chrysophthalma]